MNSELVTHYDSVRTDAVIRYSLRQILPGFAPKIAHRWHAKVNQTRAHGGCALSLGMFQWRTGTCGVVYLQRRSRNTSKTRPQRLQPKICDGYASAGVEPVHIYACTWSTYLASTDLYVWRPMHCHFLPV